MADVIKMLDGVGQTIIQYGKEYWILAGLGSVIICGYIVIKILF